MTMYIPVNGVHIFVSDTCFNTQNFDVYKYHPHRARINTQLKASMYGNKPFVTSCVLQI